MARWFHDLTHQHGGFDAELVDLANFKLPFYGDPVLPRMQQYEHTQAWSRSVAAADAYVFVMPEYSYFPPPSMMNALDYVNNQWNHKP